MCTARVVVNTATESAEKRARTDGPMLRARVVPNYGAPVPGSVPAAAHTSMPLASHASMP